MDAAFDWTIWSCQPVEEESYLNVVWRLNLKAHAVQSGLAFTLPCLQLLSIGAQRKSTTEDKDLAWSAYLGNFGGSGYIGNISHGKQAYDFTQ